jgi:hypothetical protein
MDAAIVAEETIPIFFKVDDKVKKASIANTATMVELRQLFFSKFQDAGWSMDNYPGHFSIKDQQAGLVYELEQISDLYPYAVLEIRTSHTVEPSGFGYFMVGKRTKLAIAMIGLRKA